MSSKIWKWLVFKAWRENLALGPAGVQAQEHARAL
jgi:hypothetical protein